MVGETGKVAKLISIEGNLIARRRAGLGTVQWTARRSLCNYFGRGGNEVVPQAFPPSLKTKESLSFHYAQSRESFRKDTIVNYLEKSKKYQQNRRTVGNVMCAKTGRKM